MPSTIHYNLLRRFLGAMGFLLPAVLFIGSYVQCGCNHIQDSISAYYYTPFVSVFCGILFTIAIFLFTYPGFDLADKWATNAAGVFAIGVAIFPMHFDTPLDTCNTSIGNASEQIGFLHIASAALFFITIAGISCFLFTRTHKDKEPTAEKKKRNIIYIGSGVIIYLAIGLLILDHFAIIHLGCYIPRHVFVLETVCLFAFGTSWIIKGETLYADT